MAMQINTNRRGQVVTATLALIAFAAITVAIHFDGLGGVDLAASRLAGRARTPTGVAIASAVSDVMMLPVVMAAIAGTLLRRRRRGEAPLLIGAPLGTFLSTELLKLLVHRPRPALAAIAIPSGFAFPSGHASGAAATCLTLALVLTQGQPTGRRVAWLALGVGIAVLVAASRVYLGVHYLSDV